MPSVLLVDDEPDIIEILELVLREEDLEVYKSRSGSEALQVLRDRRVDVVVSDIRMPDLTGVELLRKAKQVAPDTVFVMMTAFASTETAIEALQHGAFDYVTKPFKMEERKLLTNQFHRNLGIVHSALFTALWFGVVILTSIGASETPPSIFLRMTALGAASLTLAAQVIVIPWLLFTCRRYR